MNPSNAKVIDLGRPRRPPYGTAFLVTPQGNVIIRGAPQAISQYLYYSSDFPSPFIGTLLQFPISPISRRYGYPHGLICSKQFILTRGRKTPNRRSRIYFCISESRAVTPILYLRRMPSVWPRELNDYIDIDSHLLVASDLLEEHGLLVAATFLRKSVRR